MLTGDFLFVLRRQELKPVIVKEADDSRNLAVSDHPRFRKGAEGQKTSFSKERSVNLHFTARENNDEENGMSNAGAGKQDILSQHPQAQPPFARIITGDEATKDKTGIKICLNFGHLYLAFQNFLKKNILYCSNCCQFFAVCYVCGWLAGWDSSSRLYDSSSRSSTYWGKYTIFYTFTGV